MNLEAKDLASIVSQFQELWKYWKEPMFRIDRIVFSNLALFREFMAVFSEKVDFIDNNITKDGEICDVCKPKTPSTFPSFIFDAPLKNDENSVEIKPPRLICSLDTAFNLDHILAINPNIKDLEILCHPGTHMEQDLVMFLQDILPNLGLSIIPRFSYLHNSFEIDFSDLSSSKKRTKGKRSRKPPTKFQALLKKGNPTNFPDLIGVEYYNHSVTQNILQLNLSLFAKHFETLPSEIRENPATYSYQLIPPRSIPLPPSPLKYYDLASEGEIELRFDEYLTPFQLWHWLSHLHSKMHGDNINGLKMLRISAYYDAWENPMFSKRAGSDRFYCTLNDWLLAFQNQNYFYLQQMPSSNKTPNESLLGESHIKQPIETNPKTFFPLIAFQLTSPIEPQDFRGEILEKVFEIPPTMR